MKLIVGLGNPGIEYQFTPHNLGFLAVDRIAEQCGVVVNNRHCRAQTARARIGDEELVLAKPETFMNLSGMSVRELVEKYEVQPASGLVLLTTSWICRSARCGSGRGAVRPGTTAWSR